MPAESSFPRFVSLACHDLRTPLATVHGFARTLERVETLSEKTLTYVGMIEAASAEMIVLLDALALAARIEGNRYEPALVEADSLELVQAAAERVEAGEVDVTGTGTEVHVELESVTRGLAAFATCALRHGGLDRVTYTVEGAELRLATFGADVAPILLGDDLRDLGAATARRLIEALGGSVDVDGDTLAVRLPTT